MLTAIPTKGVAVVVVRAPALLAGRVRPEEAMDVRRREQLRNQDTRKRRVDEAAKDAEDQVGGSPRLEPVVGEDSHKNQENAWGAGQNTERDKLEVVVIHRPLVPLFLRLVRPVRPG
jgi:hypothetical protein